MSSLLPSGMARSDESPLEREAAMELLRQEAASLFPQISFVVAGGVLSWRDGPLLSHVLSALDPSAVPVPFYVDDFGDEMFRLRVVLGGEMRLLQRGASLASLLGVLHALLPGVSPSAWDDSIPADGSRLFWEEFASLLLPGALSPADELVGVLLADFLEGPLELFTLSRLVGLLHVLSAFDLDPLLAAAKVLSAPAL